MRGLLAKAGKREENRINIRGLKTTPTTSSFARLYPETSTPFRWLCTGSPKPTPSQKKSAMPALVKVWIFPRLLVPEPGVRWSKKTALLFERSEF